jgi:hypothetical protein
MAPHMPSVVVVFAWLPLFALGILVTRASNLTAAAVGKMRWFFKAVKNIH